MGWTLDDIDWGAFNPALVDPEHVKLVKAAALVERNAFDYAHYLCRVFSDDPAFRDLTGTWALEEVQHGQALARWAQLADPAWNFDAALARFTTQYQANPDAAASVRGSRSGELIARCIVETGTSSYYTALKDRSREPVLRQLCGKIAADEFRHYKTFYSWMKPYLEAEKLSRWQRFKIALGRIGEAEDDELACAFWAANAPAGEAYDHQAATASYGRRAYGVYMRHHIERLVAMTLKAAGIEPRGRVHQMLSSVGWWFLRRRVRRLAHAA